MCAVCDGSVGALDTNAGVSATQKVSVTNVNQICEQIKSVDDAVERLVDIDCGSPRISKAAVFGRSLSHPRLSRSLGMVCRLCPQSRPVFTLVSRARSRCHQCGNEL